MDSANRPNSIIRTGVVIGRDIPNSKSKVVVVESTVETAILGASDSKGVVHRSLFHKPAEQKAAKATLRVIRDLELLPRINDPTTPEVQQEIVEKL